MKELFNKLSNVSQFFREKRCVEMTPPRRSKQLGFNEDPVNPNSEKAKKGLKKAEKLRANKANATVDRATYANVIHKRLMQAQRAIEGKKIPKAMQKPDKSVKRETVDDTLASRGQSLGDALDKALAQMDSRQSIPRQSTIGAHAALDELIDEALQGNRPPRAGDERIAFGEKQPKGEQLKMPEAKQAKVLNYTVKELLKLMGKADDKALARQLAIAFNKAFKGQDKIAMLTTISSIIDSGVDKLLKSHIIFVGEKIGKTNPQLASLFEGWDPAQGTIKLAKKIKKGDILPEDKRASQHASLVKRILRIGKRLNDKEAAAKIAKALNGISNLDAVLTSLHISERDKNYDVIDTEVDSVIVTILQNNPELAYLIPHEIRKRMAVNLDFEGPRAPRSEGRQAKAMSKKVPRAQVDIGDITIDREKIKDPAKAQKPKLPKIDTDDLLAGLPDVDVEAEYGIKIPKKPTAVATKPAEDMTFDAEEVTRSPESLAEEAFKKLDPDQVVALMLKFPADSAKNFMVYKALSGKNDSLSVMARTMVGVELKNGKKINDPTIWNKANEFLLVGNDATKEHAAYVASLKGKGKKPTAVAQDQHRERVRKAKEGAREAGTESVGNKEKMASLIEELKGSMPKFSKLVAVNSEESLIRAANKVYDKQGFKAFQKFVLKAIIINQTHKDARNVDMYKEERAELMKDYDLLK